MAPSRPVSEIPRQESLAGRLVLAPPSAHRSSWMRRFKSPQTGFASGWMAVRGAKRRRGYERGFVLSDHADWPGLIRTVRESQARKVYVTHGQSDVLARYLREEEGINAEPLETLFEGESDSDLAMPPGSSRRVRLASRPSIAAVSDSIIMALPLSLIASSAF